MKASIYKGNGHFEIEEVPAPEIVNPDEVIIKNLVCSICGSDTHMTSPGYAEDMRGKILGHEIVGEIVEKGSAVTNVDVGERVVVNPNSYCGECATCRAGYQNHCENMELMGITHPGGFSEYVKSHSKLVFGVSKKLPLKYAVFAEPLACALNGFGKLGVKLGGTFLVLGCGPIGLLFANMARLSGANIVCLEPIEKRRIIAEQLGFTVWSPFDRDTVGRLKKHWGRRAEFIVDAAGRQLPMAIELAEFRARILSFANTGLMPDGTNLGGIQSKELTIKGSFIIDHTMPLAIELLGSGKINLDPVISHILPLEKIDEGMKCMRTGDGMKIILTIGTDNVDESEGRQ